MDWGTVAVGIGGAVIGAGAALVGVYIGPQLQARSELAQWRRNQLLQFCADSLAAGGRMVDAGRGTWLGTEEADTDDDANRLEHAVACIEILSEELSHPALKYTAMVNLLLTRAVIKKAKGEVGTRDELRPMVVDVTEAQRQFIEVARDLFFKAPQRPSLWQRLSPRIRPKEVPPDEPIHPRTQSPKKKPG